MPDLDTSPSRHAHRAVTWRYLTELHARADAVLARHYRRRLTLDLVARTLASSPRQLQRAYAEIGGTTFAAQLRDVRLRNAAELLAQQPLTVTDVARLVGYRQPSHFVKAFRRRYGMTPGAFRDAARRRAATNRRPARPSDGRTRRSSAMSPSDGLGPPVESGSMAHRQARALRRYSNPNSCEVFVDGVDGVRDWDAEVDDAGVGDAAPALADRAEGDDEPLDGGEALDPEPPSKPNSLLAEVPDDAAAADRPA